MQLFTAPHVNSDLRQQLGSEIYASTSANHSAANAATFFPLHTGQLKEEGAARWAGSSDRRPREAVPGATAAAPQKDDAPEDDNDTQSPGLTFAGDRVTPQRAATGG